MKHLFLMAALVVALLGVNPATLEAETKTAEAKFTPAGNEMVTVTLGDKVKLDATFKLIMVGTATPVSVKATVNNTANVKMYYSYNVAFLDKDKNLIGCQHFDLFLDPGKQGDAGTFLQLPPDQIARIAYYSVAFYESDKPIGAK